MKHHPLDGSVTCRYCGKGRLEFVRSRQAVSLPLQGRAALPGIHPPLPARTSVRDRRRAAPRSVGRLATMPGEACRQLRR
jgi:hypothetical protein